MQWLREDDTADAVVLLHELEEEMFRPSVFARHNINDYTGVLRTW
jgi:hypothetical protein